MKDMISYIKLSSVLVLIMPVLLRFTASDKSLTLYSQTKIECTKQLDIAEKEYNSGNFKIAIDLIEGCLLDPGIAHDEKVRGYRLLGLAYIGQQLKKEAAEAVKKLLLIVPDYKVNQDSDPQQLKKIIEETEHALVPQINGIAPESIEQGEGNFTITVNGSNFVYGSEIRFNGIAKPTTYVSPQELKAEIAANDIVKIGNYEIIVYSPIMGGKLSGPEKFKVSGSSAFPWKWIAIGGGAVVAAAVAIITLGGKSNNNGGNATILADPPGRP